MILQLFENLSLCDRKAISDRASAWFSYLRNGRELGRVVKAVRAKDPSRRIICISKTQHMGDIVACEPVARQVRRNQPDAFIVWCLQKNYAELMEHNPAVNYVLPVNCLTEWILFSSSTLFDEVIDLEMDGKPCKECRLSLKKKRDSGITYNNYYQFGNLLDVYSRCGNLQVEDKHSQIFIPDAIKERVNALVDSDAPYVVVHCSSNEKCKDWCVEKWRELLRGLPAFSLLRTLEVGLEPVLSHLQLPRYQSLCGQLSILETAEVIRRSVLFIGVDSGPAHLANAVGAKGVVLIGKYASFSRYQPYNGNFAGSEYATLVYSTDAAAAIEVDAVRKAVENRLREVLSTCGITASAN